MKKLKISDKNSDNYNNNITENEKTENNNNNIYINENIDKNKDNNSNNNIEYNDLFNTNENKESNLINYNTLSKDDYVTEKSTSTQSPNPSNFLGKKDNKGLKTGFGIEKRQDGKSFKGIYENDKLEGWGHIMEIG